MALLSGEEAAILIGAGIERQKALRAARGFDGRGGKTEGTAAAGRPRTQ